MKSIFIILFALVNTAYAEGLMTKDLQLALGNPDLRVVNFTPERQVDPFHWPAIKKFSHDSPRKYQYDFADEGVIVSKDEKYVLRSGNLARSETRISRGIYNEEKKAYDVTTFRIKDQKIQRATSCSRDSKSESVLTGKKYRCYYASENVCRSIDLHRNKWKDTTKLELDDNNYKLILAFNLKKRGPSFANEVNAIEIFSANTRGISLGVNHRLISPTLETLEKPTKKIDLEQKLSEIVNTYNLCKEYFPDPYRSITNSPKRKSKSKKEVR